MKDRFPPIYSLWILITLSLVIFIGLSFSNDIHLGNHTLSKAYFPETLLAKTEDQDTIITIEQTLPDTLTIQADKIAEPDTTIHNVLIFGDSMTHNLAMSLAKYGTKNNFKVTSVTWESSSIPKWLNSGKIQEYIELSHPDFIFISLGSNEMELKNFDRRLPDIQGIVKAVGKTPFVWVGPPLWKEDKGLYPVLAKGVPEGLLFKLEKMEIERGPDHVHPTRHGADQWADTLMRWIAKSPHPILNNPPDSGTTTKGHKFIYLHPND